MLVVIEGPDGSGKSTLLEQLRSIRGTYFVLLRHSCRPLNFDDVLKFMKFTDAIRVLPKVIDRHPLISEPIYGPILRGSNLIEWDEEGSIRYLTKTVSRIVYCRPARLDILEHFDRRPQLDGVREKMGEIIDAYDQRMKKLSESIAVVHHDWTKSPNLTPQDLHRLVFGS